MQNTTESAAATVNDELAITAAVSLLERSGYEIAEREWECEYGYVDLVARDGDAVVFVDVLFIAGAAGSMPPDDVSPRALAMHEMTAMSYLAQHPDLVDVPVRFDALTIKPIAQNRGFVRLHKNMFGRTADEDD